MTLAFKKKKIKKQMFTNGHIDRFIKQFSPFLNFAKVGIYLF